jgi:chromosome segregation ATPase
MLGVSPDQIVSLTNEINNRIIATENALVSMQHAISKLAEDFATAESTSARINSDNAQTQTQIYTLLQDLGRRISEHQEGVYVRRESMRHESSHENLERLDALRVKYEVEKREADQLRVENSSLKSDVERLEGRCHVLETAEREVNSLHEQVANANSRLMEAENTRLQMEQACFRTQSELTTSQDNVQNMNHQLRYLTEACASISTTMNQSQSQLSERISETRDLKVQLAAERARADKAQEISQEVAAFRSLLQDTKDLEKQLAETRSLLNEANEKVNAQATVPPGGLASELAGIYAKLADTFKDIPVAPGGWDTFDMQTVALRIAPLLITEGAKDNLFALLDAKVRDWHCCEQVVEEGLPAGYVGYGSCRKHRNGCVLVCVGTDGTRDLLDFKV